MNKSPTMMCLATTTKNCFCLYQAEYYLKYQQSTSSPLPRLLQTAHSCQRFLQFKAQRVNQNSFACVSFCHKHRSTFLTHTPGSFSFNLFKSPSNMWCALLAANRTLTCDLIGWLGVKQQVTTARQWGRGVVVVGGFSVQRSTIRRRELYLRVTPPLSPLHCSSSPLPSPSAQILRHPSQTWTCKRSLTKKAWSFFPLQRVQAYGPFSLLEPQVWKHLASGWNPSPAQ